ncbi:MAG: hypothetical protein Q7R57_07155 [Dehalococcoidales bacterium]|nr:hypothetical protein [Dehalococcoidales bacterium]
MAETIGKIEKPPAEDYQKGRRLFFVPLVYSGKDAPPEYAAKYDAYWPPVDNQLKDLEAKLGKVNRIYHELIPAGGEDGLKALQELHEKSHRIVKARVEAGAQLEATEDAYLLTEFLDWGRCLAVGLQNEKVFNQVYQTYVEAGKKRNEFIAGQINLTLKADEIGLLFMREGHQVQFPGDIQVFYISPPELDHLKRWLRDREATSGDAKP